MSTDDTNVTNTWKYKYNTPLVHYVLQMKFKYINNLQIQLPFKQKFGKHKVRHYDKRLHSLLQGVQWEFNLSIGVSNLPAIRVKADELAQQGKKSTFAGPEIMFQ